MDKQKIVTLVLSAVVVVLVVAIVIYAQVVWQSYRETQMMESEMATTSDETFMEEDIQQLTPEENMEVLDSLYVPTEEEFSVEEQESILNSLSTTSPPVLPNEI